jgi:hypothetical protein
MSGFVLHPEALTDLDDIWEFIASDNVGAADRLPQVGHIRPDLTSRPLRFHTVRELFDRVHTG